MNQGPLIFLGALFALATSWLGFVLAPQLQLGRQPLVEVADTGVAYPPMRPGMARQGERVYRANGCFYCHSQQVRAKDFGSDVLRGWGGRPGKVQSVAQDYLYDEPVMLGSQRVGPDLTNIGLRQPDADALLWHLYNPQLSAPGSVMPPYRFLFEHRKLKAGEQRSENALTAISGAPSDEQVIPSDNARALAAYLISLHSDGILYETPPPAPPPTNSVAALNSTNALSTNAPAPTAKAPTNAPAK